MRFGILLTEDSTDKLLVLSEYANKAPYELLVDSIERMFDTYKGIQDE